MVINTFLPQTHPSRCISNGGRGPRWHLGLGVFPARSYSRLSGSRFLWKENNSEDSDNSDNSEDSEDSEGTETSDRACHKMVIFRFRLPSGHGFSPLGNFPFRHGVIYAFLRQVAVPGGLARLTCFAARASYLAQGILRVRICMATLYQCVTHHSERVQIRNKKGK